MIALTDYILVGLLILLLIKVEDILIENGYKTSVRLLVLITMMFSTVILSTGISYIIGGFSQWDFVKIANYSASLTKITGNLVTLSFVAFFKVV